MVSEPLLNAVKVTKSFGALRAVDQVNLQVYPGSITSVIGPNGAGKTTLFNLLCNFISPDQGEVFLAGEPIHRLPPHRIARRGMVRTFQVARVLSRLTVLDNMRLGAQGQTGENFWCTWYQGRAISRQERQLRDQAMAILESVGLAAMADTYAGALSGGQRKLLEIARALMSEPKLLLLDEPAAGVNPRLIEQICEYITALNRQGLTFLIIEHNMDLIMSLSDQVWVLAEGRNLVEGTPAQVQTNHQVLEAYLGC